MFVNDLIWATVVIIFLRIVIHRKIQFLRLIPIHVLGEGGEGVVGRGNFHFRESENIPIDSLT